MRKYFKLPLLGLVLIVFGLSGCDEQEVSDPISPDGYATATFATDFTGTELTEGDTIIYTVTIDKMNEFPTSFTIQVDPESTVDLDYIEVIDAVIQPYSLEAQMLIVIHDDGMPTEDMNIKFEVGCFNLAEMYTLNAKTVNPVLDLKVKNYNDPTLLTVVFGWDSEDDIDIVTWSNTDDYPMTEWGAGGATSANPETDKSIWLADPVGEYYVSIMNWGAPSFTYHFVIGHPDGSVQFIDGTFDSENLDKYTSDLWMAWGDPGYDSYRVLKVVNDGTKFVVTALN